LNKFDVIIIGAGPAGSTAAYFLAQEGLKIAIIDKAKFPRNKVCGGGIVGRTISYYPELLNNVNATPIKRLQISELTINKIINIQSPTPLIYSIKRSEFDYKLLNNAINKGAVFFPNCKVESIDLNNTTIRVKSLTNVFNTTAVIGADGAMGISSKIVNPKRRNIAAAIEIEIEGRFDEKIAQFDFGAVTHGYGWVFPKVNSASVGIVSLNPKDEIKNALKKYLGIKKLPQNIGRFRGFFIPLFTSFSKVNFKNLMLTGDALGLADPITFEGISQAILSGKLAAKAIINSNSPLKAAEYYNQLIKKDFLNELFFAKMLSLLVYRTPKIRKFLINHYGFNLASIVAKVTLGKTTYASEVKNIGNYLKFFKYF